MNNVSLVGRLTKDVDLRYTPNGVAVANFTLAVNRIFKKEGQPDADFIQCQVWQKQAENAANYLKKGSMAGVTGRIETRNFEGQDGKRVYVTEVVANNVQFLEPKSRNEGGQSNGASGGQNGYTGQNGGPSRNDAFNNPNGQLDISDDDLPF